MFKGKSILVSLGIVLACGLMFSFLAQALVWTDFPLLDLSLGSGKDAFDFFALSGWENKVDGQLQSVGAKSTLVFNIAAKTRSKLGFTVSFPNLTVKDPYPVQIFVNDRLIGQCPLVPSKDSVRHSLIIKKDLLHNGFDTITFQREEGVASLFVLSGLRIYNFNRLPFIRGAYGIFERPHWFLAADGSRMRWRLHTKGMLVLFSVWLVSFLVLPKFSSMGANNILRILSLSYLLAALPLCLIYFFSRLFGCQIIFTRTAFLVLAAATTVILQVNYCFKVIKLVKVRKSVVALGHDLTGKRIVFLSFAYFLLLSCLSAIGLLLNKAAIAEELMNWAFLFVLLSVIFRSIQERRQRGD